MSDSWLGLEHKVVAVTGAVGGMGRVICEEFAKQGASLVLLDIKEEALTDFAEELSQNYSVEILPITIDTRNEEMVDRAVRILWKTSEKLMY